MHTSTAHQRWPGAAGQWPRLARLLRFTDGHTRTPCTLHPSRYTCPSRALHAPRRARLTASSASPDTPPALAVCGPRALPVGSEGRQRRKGCTAGSRGTGQGQGAGSQLRSALHSPSDTRIVSICLCRRSACAALSLNAATRSFSNASCRCRWRMLMRSASRCLRRSSTVASARNSRPPRLPWLKPRSPAEAMGLSSTADTDTGVLPEQSHAPWRTRDFSSLSRGVPLRPTGSANAAVPGGCRTWSITRRSSRCSPCSRPSSVRVLDTRGARVRTAHAERSWRRRTHPRALPSVPRRAGEGVTDRLDVRRGGPSPRRRAPAGLTLRVRRRDRDRGRDADDDDRAEPDEAPGLSDSDRAADSVVPPPSSCADNWPTRFRS